MIKKIITGLLFILTYSFAYTAESAVNIIVPFPPGGAYDSVARKFAKFVTEETKTSIVISNVLGAGGYIGLQKLESSPPNTLMITSSAIYNHFIDYNIPIENFKFIAVLADGPYFLTVSRNKGLTCEQLKTNPRIFFAATGGVGSGSSIPVSMIQEKYSNFVDVPYKGTVQSLTDLMSGQVDLSFVSGFFNARPDLIYLANTSENPYDGIPTMKSCLGINKTITAHYVIVAKKSVDDNIVQEINHLAGVFAKQEDIINFYKQQGIVSKVGTLDQTDKLVKFEFEKVKRIYNDTKNQK